MSFKLRRTNGRRTTPTKKGDSLVIQTKYDDDDSSGQSTERADSEYATWEVERVLGKRIDDKGELSFLLKWKSYDETTWEPIENLSCDKLILDFEDKSSLNKWREHSSSGNRPRSFQIDGSESNKNLNGSRVNASATSNGNESHQTQTSKRFTRNSMRR